MNQFLNGNQDLRSSSKFNVMVKVQYTLSRSKCQAGEIGSSLGERPEIAQPALQRRNLYRMGIQHPACIFIKHCSWIINNWLFGTLTDSLLSHPSWHNFDKLPLYTNVVEGYVYEMYFFIPHATAYGGITDQAERGVKLQECFPLTKWDAHQSVRLCSYWKTKSCL